MITTLASSTDAHRDALTLDAPYPTIPGYTMQREIASSGQSRVLLAQENSTGRAVAIKLLLDARMGDFASVARFERERRLLAHLNHPHIITIKARGDLEGRAYLVTDYVGGPPIDLAAMAMTVREVVALFVKVSKAAHAAHTHGVIHRDIKPANILVDEHDEPVLIDFGLAKSTDDDGPPISTSLTIVGTLDYIAPERLNGGPPDIRSDVYAIGVVLYECLADAIPFAHGNDVQRLRAIAHDDPIPLRQAAGGPRISPQLGPKNIPTDLEAVVMKAINRRVEDRYQTALELADDLRRFLDGDAVEAQLPRRGYRIRRFLHRYRFYLTCVGVTLLGLVVALMASLSALNRASDQIRQTQTALAMSGLQMMGSVDRDAGRLGVALRQFQTAIRMGNEHAQPIDAVQLQAYGATHRVAELLITERRIDEARPHVAQAFALAQRMRREHHGVARYERQYAFALELRGRVRIVDEDWSGAATDLTESVKAFERDYLTTGLPNTMAELASTRAMLARCQLRLGRPDLAESMLAQSVRELTELTDGSPCDSDNMELVTVTGELGVLQLRLRRNAEARKTLESAERSARAVLSCGADRAWDAKNAIAALEQNLELARRRLGY